MRRASARFFRFYYPGSVGSSEVVVLALQSENNRADPIGVELLTKETIKRY